MRFSFTTASQMRMGLLASFLLLVQPALAQTGNTIIAYPSGSAISTAPGSIRILAVVGIGAKLTAPVTASGFPFPTSLAGISVVLNQSAAPRSIPVPILAVTPMSTCANPNQFPLSPCGRYTQLTIQIPFELSYRDLNYANLVVTENGVAGGALEVFAGTYDVGILAVTHADGSIANWQSPAKSGEVMVLWATGLGPTIASVPTGQATPSPAPSTQFIPTLSFDYRPNAPPMLRYCAPASQCPKVYPLFSGLTPGYAGLYQVNFVVPPPPAGTPPCNTIDGNSESVASNLTVTLISPGSVALGGGHLCVDPASSSASGSAAVALASYAVRVPFQRPVVPDMIRWFPGSLEPILTRQLFRATPVGRPSIKHE